MTSLKEPQNLCSFHPLFALQYISSAQTLLNRKGMGIKAKTVVCLILILFIITGCNNDLSQASGEFDTTSEYKEITEHMNTLEHDNEDKNTDIVKIFGCDADLISKGADSEQVTKLYLEDFAEGKEKGYIPVLVFLDDILEEKINLTLNGKNKEEYIEETLSTERSNGKKLFDKRYSDLEKYYGDELMAINDAKLDAMLSLYGKSGTGKFLPSSDAYEGELYLLKVPTNNPFEIFAWLPFGGWNESPDTSDMISMCEYWYNEYGAVPAAISHDTLTFYLRNPVADKETAVKAAKEQCGFSSEVLGMGGIESYVKMTFNGNIWTFWWD